MIRKLPRPSWHCLSFLAVLLAWPAPCARAGRMHTYIYDLLVENTHHQITMVVDREPDRVKVTYYNELGDKEISQYETPHRFLGARYYNPQRRLAAESVYDYRNHALRLSGDLNVRYPLEGDIFDNNGSLFYLFSVYYPEPSRRLRFKLVQSNLSYVKDPFLRTLVSRLVGPVEMILKHVRSEPLVFSGNARETEVYEFRIFDGGLAAFWPYKYYFWYDRDTRRLLRHEGLNADKKPTVYTLVDDYEWARPEPELPTL